MQAVTLIAYRQVWGAVNYKLSACLVDKNVFSTICQTIHRGYGVGQSELDITIKMHMDNVVRASIAYEISKRNY